MYRLKAGFLFNSISFVEWPTNKLSGTNITVIVGCLPDDPAAPFLARSLEGKPDRPIKLMFLRERSGPRDCHLLFINLARRTQVDDMMGRLEKPPVLTVSEVDQFAHRGGMINFIRHERTFRFEINVEAAARAGLRISSRLASMATVVKTTTPP